MQLKQLGWGLLVLLGMIQACTSTAPSSQSENQQQETAPKVGGDKDEHGCLPAAGYQWSELRQECIRIFEQGVALEAKAKDLDPSLAAYIVFKSDEDDSQVELFLPGNKKTLVLPRKGDGKDDAGTWSNKQYTLTLWRGMYSLENANKQLLYQGSAVK